MVANEYSCNMLCGGCPKWIDEENVCFYELRRKAQVKFGRKIDLYNEA